MNKWTIGGFLFILMGIIWGMFGISLIFVFIYGDKYLPSFYDIKFVAIGLLFLGGSVVSFYVSWKCWDEAYETTISKMVS